MPQRRTQVKVWATRRRTRACTILAARHRGEYAAILAEVREADPRPVPPGKPGRPRRAA